VSGVDYGLKESIFVDVGVLFVTERKKCPDKNVKGWRSAVV
jgi:hypothetical protein